MTILGIDISKWDGNWDAAKAKQAGASFVFIKASQATFSDPQFSANWQKAKNAGLLRGAYHYLDYTKSGTEQANYFADLLKNDPGELPPVIDYELRRTDNNPAAALGFLRDCLDQLTRRSELYADAKVKFPMIYTGPGFWTEYGDVTKGDYWIQFPLWNAHWTTSPSPLLPAPWTMWQFWQFSSKGPGEAFGSEAMAMDMDRFNGTLNELMEFAGMRIPVVNLNEMVATLDGKVTKLENLVASIDHGDPISQQVTSRVENLEGQFSDIETSISSLATSLNQRITGVEQMVAGLKNIPVRAASIPTIADQSGKGVPTKTLKSLAGNIADNEIPASTLEEEPVAATQVSEASAIPQPAAALETYATCIASALNVRMGPGASHPTVASIRLGQRVKVIDRQNGWAQFEKPSGWSSEAYLTFDQGIPSDEAVNSNTTSSPASYGICNTSGLNVRSGPGATFPVVGGLTYGQRIKITGHKSGWAQIDAPSGWCNETYLSFA